VLLDDDFGSIVKAIRLGRRIYDNLRKALAYILAIHVPIAGMALLPIVLGMPILLTPALIAILEMIIDPACSIALEAEPEERDVMSRPPRSPQAILIPPTLIAASLLQGAVALVVCATLFLFAARRGLPESELRSFALLLLVCINVALIFANRTFTHSLRSALLRSNTPLRWGLMLISAILVTIFAVPAIRSYLGLGPINPANASICFAAGFALLVLLELGKSARWAAMLRS
jgi:P-type Ca2+ transporter type 2C